MGHSHHRRHGRVLVGRIEVLIACVLVTPVNAWIFKRAAAPPEPVKVLEIIALISVPWILAGAWGLCTRKQWGRGILLGLLYIGSVACLMGWIAGTFGAFDNLRPCSTPMLCGAVVYSFCALVLSYSRDVRRLTSRALE
jgi:hypothetical protein